VETIAVDALRIARRATPGSPDAFASAVAALEPFFDPGLTWSGAHLEHFAYRALRDLHPELTIAQAYVLVVAAKRLYTARRPPNAR
jgi:hypothetical protein